MIIEGIPALFQPKRQAIPATTSQRLPVKLARTKN
jgi:hypothetical protein